MDTQQIAKFVMVLGVSVFVLGGALWLFGRVGLPLGRLPGDFRIQLGSFTCVFPLASSIILSILLTIALNLLARWLNK
ncbi:MAG: DUF2905 domain-containing protein [Anaerolineae bacterium]|nr:MAG: DUF2905 domain-containing protein [Anaerolineae bacterium]